MSQRQSPSDITRHAELSHHPIQPSRSYGQMHATQRLTIHNPNRNNAHTCTITPTTLYLIKLAFQTRPSILRFSRYYMEDSLRVLARNHLIIILVEHICHSSQLHNERRTSAPATLSITGTPHYLVDQLAPVVMQREPQRRLADSGGREERLYSSQIVLPLPSAAVHLTTHRVPAEE